jgi:hypothetical protein
MRSGNPSRPSSSNRSIATLLQPTDCVNRSAGYAPAQPGREAPLPRRLQHHTRWSALFPADGEARMFELTSARPLPRVYRSAATGRFAETPTRPAQLHGPVADRLPRHRTGCWLLRDGRIAAARANRHRLVPARLDGGVISVHCLA